MWELKKEKTLSSKYDLELFVLVKEMAYDTYATYADEFENHFKVLLKELKPSNQFVPEAMYKVTARNLYSVEIWKLYPNGEFKEKLIQADLVKESLT